MTTAIEIYNNHLAHFKTGAIKIDSASPKFKSAGEVQSYLNSGSILPVLVIKSIESSQSIYNQMLVWSLYSFNGSANELKFKKVFITALNQLGIK